MPHFGRLSDKYGDRNIAVITSIGTAIVPLLFLFVHPETSWLAIPIFMLSGFVWAGVDLTFYNLLLDVTEEKSRAVQIAEYGIMTSVPMIVAPVIGGFVADATGSWILGGIPFLFAVSSVLRIFAGALLFRLPEPRAKREFEFKEVLRKTMAFHPEKGVLTMIRTLHKFRSGRL
jgi:MFS family permease